MPNQLRIRKHTLSTPQYYTATELETIHDPWKENGYIFRGNWLQAWVAVITTGIGGIDGIFRGCATNWNDIARMFTAAMANGSFHTLNESIFDVKRSYVTGTTRSLQTEQMQRR